MINAIASGRLIRDPEALTGKSGAEFAVATIAVATQGENDLLLKLVAFKSTATELLGLSKGDAVSATGRIQARGYIAKDTGEAKAAIELVVDKLLSAYALDKKRTAATGGGKPPADDKGKYRAAAEAQRSPGKDLGDDMPW